MRYVLLCLILNLLSRCLQAQIIESESPVYNDLEIGEVEFRLEIFDLELGDPIIANIAVYTIQDSSNPLEISGKAINGQKIIKLPIRNEYKIDIKESNYLDTSLVINLRDVESYKIQKRILLRPKKVPYEINIKDIETSQSLAFGATLNNKNRKESINLSPENQQNGLYMVKIRAGDEYELEVNNSKDYFFYAKTINTSREREEIRLTGKGRIEVALTTLKPGAKIKLNNITFASNSIELNADAVKELNRVIGLLLQHPKSIIEIAAHTDNTGSAQYNMQLSQRRAKVVHDYLVSHRIEPSRLKAVGYGKSRPLVLNDTEENRAKNRRFELIVLKL